MRILQGTIYLAITICFLTPARAAPATPSNQNPLPPHSTICAGDKVHKSYLISFLLTKIKPATNQAVQIRISSNPELQARLLTTDDPASYCAMVTKSIRSQCSTTPHDKECSVATESCRSYQQDAVNYAQYIFENLTTENARATPAYTEASSLRRLPPFQQVNKYFDYEHFNDNANPISCTGTDIPAAPPTAQRDTSALAKFRLRGKSDDLYIDRTLPQFKSTTPATVTWTGTDKDNYSAKVVGALGYEFDVGTDGQLIPYTSFYQSLTDAANKPRVIDPTSNVAFGFLATDFSANPFNENIQDVFTAKPQYLFNTADQSEIASLRLIYAPWADLPNVLINANTYQMLPFLPGPTWASLLFDLRNDSGAYTNRGDTPAIVAVNKNFDRAGTRVGLALTNDPTFPSLTLLVAENYLYGIAGYYRNVSSFQTSLTYNLDSNNYFGLTAAYQNGRDEDTAVASHTYTVGLTVRY